MHSVLRCWNRKPVLVQSSGNWCPTVWIGVYYFTCMSLCISKAIALEIAFFYIIKWCEMLCALCEWQFWRFSSARCSCSCSISFYFAKHPCLLLFCHIIIKYVIYIYLLVQTLAHSLLQQLSLSRKRQSWWLKTTMMKMMTNPHKRLVHYTNQQYAFYQIK